MNNTGSGCEIYNHKTNQNKNPWEKPSLCCALVHPSELDELAKTWAMVEEVMQDIWFATTEAVASLLRISTKTSWSCLGAQRCHRPKWKNDRLFSQELQQQTEGPKSFFPEVKRDLGRWWNFKSSVHSFTRSAMEEECPQARPLAPSLDKSHSSLLCSQISDLFQN